MDQTQAKRSKICSSLLYTILGAGILLRLIVFVQNRSLFIDEASLGLNIVRRSFGGLFESLDEAYAPPLYTCISRCFCLLFGNTEFALRAFPLICGILSLFVFFLLIKRFCGNVYLQWYPLALLAFSLVFIQFATEVKQYSSDVLAALTLLYLASNERFSFVKRPDKKYLLAFCWALLGALMVWFSMPSVFFLAAIGIYFLVKSLPQKDDVKKAFGEMIPVLLLGFVWLASFGLYYYSILSNDIGDGNLKDYHAKYFFPLIPSSMEELNTQWKLIRQLFGGTFGPTVIAIAWGMLSVGLGIFAQFKKCKRNLFLLSFPILLVLVASSFEYYSLIKRLTLFFLPNLMLLSLVGTAWLFERSHAYIKGLILAILLLIVINQKSYPYFFTPFQIEELRPLLYQLESDWSEIEALYVHHEAVPAFHFYTQDYAQKADFDFLNNAPIICANWEEKEKALLAFLEQKKASKIVLLFSHSNEAEIARVLEEVKAYGKIIETKEVIGAKGIYVLME